MDSGNVLERSNEFLECMRKEMSSNNYDIMRLLITDVLQNGSDLLAVGDSKIISQAFGVELINNRAFLSGVLSRKKQIVPKLMSYIKK